MAIEFTIPDEWDETECPTGCPMRVFFEDGSTYCTLSLNTDEESLTLRPSRRCPGSGTYKLIRVNKPDKE